jgi:hypothetical protein
MKTAMQEVKTDILKGQEVFVHCYYNRPFTGDGYNTVTGFFNEKIARQVSHAVGMWKIKLLKN